MLMFGSFSTTQRTSRSESDLVTLTSKIITVLPKVNTINTSFKQRVCEIGQQITCTEESDTQKTCVSTVLYSLMTKTCTIIMESLHAKLLSSILVKHVFVFFNFVYIHVFSYYKMVLLSSTTFG